MDAVLGPKIRELFEMDAENKRRLRDLEQRVALADNTMKRTDANIAELKGNVLDISTNFKSDRIVFESKVKELENIINDIVSNMKRLAEKSEVAGLKELIEIYSPVKSQFITRQEVENMLDERAGSSSSTRKGSRRVLQ